MRTIKFIFLFVSFNLFLFQLSAQSSFGFKGGYTDAWPDYGDVELPENAETHVKGFNFSILYAYQISNNFKVGIEPGFVQRGAACFPGWQPDFVGDTKVFLNYLEAPLMLSGQVAIPKTNFNVFGKIGFGASYLLSAKEEISPAANIEFPVERRKLDLENEPLRRFDYGAYSSLGFAYSLNSIFELFLESTFYYGLPNFEENNTGKNRSLSFNLGFNYKFL